MEIRKVIICLLFIFLLTGCTSKTTLEDVLKKEDYSCLKKICTKKQVNQGEEVITYTVDINNTTYEVTKGYKDYSTTSLAIDYNWNTKEVKVTSIVASIEFNLEGIRDEDISCTSKDKDKTFVKAECNNLKEDLNDYLESLDKTLNKVE